LNLRPPGPQPGALPDCATPRGQAMISLSAIMSDSPAANLRHGVHVPNLREYGDPEVLVRLAVEAEQAGWDGFFVWDHMLHRRTEPEAVVDPWVTLAACAVKTERIKLGTMITPLSRRRPWKVARETATLDLLSAGRVVLGAGLGSPRDAEFEAFGEEADERRRAQRLDEALAILAGLWTGEWFAHSGEHFALDEMRFIPKPAQARIPVWIGGNWPNRRPFRRAARWDGVVPEKVGGGQPTPAELREVLAYIAEERGLAALETGRQFDVVIGGVTAAADAEGLETAESYAEAGATWWMERFHPAERSPRQAQKRIAGGPAR
jgi:alkanesulfonate monooxygenase SsuD/methylene tetrahydromethanopterin reductase-like flavin-dependent oxidoreductase (luciferase family)